jgi:hypothetical protein
LAPSCNVNVTDEYNVCLDLKSISGSKESWMAAFVRAKEKMESIIIGELPKNIPSLLLNASESFICTDYPPVIDDAYICAEEKIMDGPGGVFAVGFPLYTRASDKINPLTGEKYRVTLTGHILFDTADLEDLMNSGEFDSVVLHEMAHALGAGTLWEENGLYTPGSGTYATGTHADDAWKSMGCSGPLPIELDFGGGTMDVHWDEECLKAEILTGVKAGASQPISNITIGSLEDIGYIVDYGQADSFAIADLGVCGASCPEKRRVLGEREHKWRRNLDRVKWMQSTLTLGPCCSRFTKRDIEFFWRHLMTMGLR